MKRALTTLVALTVLALAAAPAFCVIYEVADKDGNVTHYKYTDRKGSIVFTDSLGSIPESVRKGSQIVRVGPPPRPKAQAAAQPAAQPGERPADEPGAPAGTLPPLREALQPTTPATASAPQAEEGGFPWLLAAIGVGVLAGGAGLALRMRSAKGAAAPRTAASVYRGRERPTGLAEAPARRAERTAEVPGQPAAPWRAEPPAEAPVGEPPAAAPHREESPREAIERLVQAGDYAGAARLCDAQGEIGRGAELYLRAGLYAEAAANFEQIGDHQRAGECHLKGGEAERAAASFAQAGDPVRGYAALSGYYYDQGDTRQAAAWAEKAGDLVQAATYFQEIGELGRAADLFFRGGFHAEAAEIFALLGDLPRAAEAFAKSGRPLEAAQALEKSGGDARRVAELYEQGGAGYPAGRLFVKLGDLDRALAALQQVDAAAADYPQASLLVGMIFLKRGMTNLAQEKFVKVIAERPIQRATLEPYYFLALCHERSGEPERARAIFEKILAEDYNFRDVQARLARRGTGTA